jgi:hypothetical protein
MGQSNTIHQNGKARITEFNPALIQARADDQQARYMAALELVRAIDENLTTGRQHYRTKSGQLLRTLDEVVRAILADNLLVEAESVAWPQDLARAA